MQNAAAAVFVSSVVGKRALIVGYLVRCEIEIRVVKLGLARVD